MNARLPISVFIITFNEADRLHVTIGSVKDWVEEVVVVDSGSTDNTVQLAESLGARVFYNPWPGYGMQKRFGEDQCKNRWLMNLDADEEVTPELKHEIIDLFAGSPREAGYVLRIRDLLPGEKTLSPFAHTNYVLRLYDRTQGRFSESPVHDSVITQGKTRLLESPVLHRSVRSLAHLADKINAYTTAQAQNLGKKGMRFPLLRLLAEIPFAFFKDYVLRGYMFRGRRGFINAVMYSYGRFLRIAKYLELRGK